MKHLLTKAAWTVLAALAFLTSPFEAKAQYEGEGELLVTIHTDMYESDGESNQFSMALGSYDYGKWVDIDCGYGTEELEVNVAELNSDGDIGGSTYDGKVSSEGIIRIYGDPEDIDYLNLSGMEITEVEFHKDLKLTVLNLEHNSLKSVNLDNMKTLQALYIMDNPFTEETPFMLGRLENLLVLEMGEIEYVSPNFDFRNFPELRSVDAYYSRSLLSCDPSECPNLVRLSLEMTGVASVDVTKNEYLSILNVSDSRVTELDVTKNAKLTELYFTHGSNNLNKDCKFTSIDLSQNPELAILFCTGNNLTSLDLSHNKMLNHLTADHNKLKSLDLSENTELINVNIMYNDMDFVTLPLIGESWGDYYLQQNDLSVAKSYKEGDIIDLSARVMRDNTTTGCKLYYTEKDSPSDMKELDESYYSFDTETGLLTLNMAFDNEIIAEFNNNKFEGYPLQTTRFKVLTEANYNARKTALTIASGSSEGETVNIAFGIEGATPENPKKVWVEFGDGTVSKTPILVTSDNPETWNITGKRNGYANIVLYTERDEEVTVIRTDGLNITNIQGLANMPNLKVLSLRNAGLYNIDLSYNAYIEYLDLSNNNLYYLSLKGKTSYYYKSGLKTVLLSGNNLSAIEVDDLYSIHKLDISNNKFEEDTFKNTDNLVWADFSGNKFTSMLLQYATNLEYLDLSDNELTEVTVPDEAPLTYYNITNNRFDFTNMPDSRGLSDEQFIYAPQKDYSVAPSSPGINLTSLYNIEVDDVEKKTTFVWKKEDGTLLTKGVDYTQDVASFRFLSPVLGQNVYCEMSNEHYPQFSGTNVLKTSMLTVIDAPQVEIASFKTPYSWETAEIILRSSQPGTSVYIDWSGDGNLSQYMLMKDEPYTFSATTVGGTEVKVYLADEKDVITVFEINNVTMQDFTCDAAHLSSLDLLALESCSLTNLDGVPVLSSLKELKLSGNKLTSIDFTKFPNLVYTTLNSNNFSTIDLSGAKKLQYIFLSYNKNLSTVTMNGNNSLISLDLGGCALTELPDFSGAPNMYQLWLNNNQLKDVSKLEELKHLTALNIVGNQLDFTTIPLPRDQWASYSYNAQADLQVESTDGMVDLSSQAVVDGTETVFRWFIGKPTYDSETGEFDGEELIEGEEYTVTGGVTIFLLENDLDDLVCVMMNDVFEGIILYTEPMYVAAVDPDQIVSVKADAIRDYYTLDGVKVSRPGHAGIYVSGTKKVYIK